MWQIHFFVTSRFGYLNRNQPVRSSLGWRNVVQRSFKTVLGWMLSVGGWRTKIRSTGWERPTHAGKENISRYPKSTTWLLHSSLSPRSLGRSRSPHQCQTYDTRYGTQSQLSEQRERVNNNVIAANSAVSGIQLCQRQVFLPARVTQMDHAPCAQRDVHRARTPGALRGGGQR